MAEKKEAIAAKEIKNKEYPAESVGRLMTNKVPIVDDKATIKDVEKVLLKETKEFETINYIYVINKSKKLKGIISIKEVLAHPGATTKVKELMTKGKELVTVRAHSVQGRATLHAIQNNIKAMPVVDKDDRFLGVLTSDSILQIVDNEHVEDILRLGGVYHKGPFKSVLNISVFESLRHRLPWLALGLVGGLLIAGVLKHYEELISLHPILAAFIPMVVYMASAVGSQTQAFIIRDLASYNASGGIFPFLKYFIKQLHTIMVIGVIMSLVLYFLTFLFYGTTGTSLILSIALFFAVMSSLFTGLFVPYIFYKAKFDPADASGPIGTIIQDITSVVVYFAIIMILL
ncbi:CBS domain-containing protein [Candidatus Falkowbacteria bacterium]|nr:CBS domain-containing protein [Candidatus Falkowbacteria bacterium]